MANLFETYIQTELPKRPFLPTDVPTESIIVRRGAGPRQLAGIKLEDGQVLGMVEGALVGIEANQGAQVDAVTHDQTEAQTTWTIVHNRNNANVLVSVYDASGVEVFPNTKVATANNVVLDFTEAQIGKAQILFLPVPEPVV
jgi:hypothetical protein